MWSSEIEKFPREISARHFPNSIQLGDINSITDAPHVDIVTASSPCQDISIAGKLGGIRSARSGLFFRAVELVRRCNAEFFIWENVPNVININGGRDFQAILEEITQTAIPIPERGFGNAGVVDFGRGQLAYRILDAQHFGLAQRRKRIFLVADLTARRAAKILFEPASMSGNSATGEVEKQTVAARTRTNSDFAVYENHGQDSRIKRLGDIAPTVTAKFGTGGNNVPLVAYGIGRDAFNQGVNAKFMPTIEYELCPPHYGAWCRRRRRAKSCTAAYSRRMRTTSRFARQFYARRLRFCTLQSSGQRACLTDCRIHFEEVKQ